jgi:uncharacterized glyoxalase superfamily protein PhnB
MLVIGDLAWLFIIPAVLLVREPPAIAETPDTVTGAVGDEARADKVFAALADGGQVQMPLGKTFWSPRFGMLTDRFGVGWMINVRGSSP